MEPFDAARPLDALCEDIVARYHAPLHRTLPLIREDLAAVSSVDGSQAVNMMRLAFAGLADEIESNLSREEHLLFPALGAIASAERDHRSPPPSPFATVLHPIRMMEAEHARIESGMAFVRGLALEVGEPVSSMPAWQRCLHALSLIDAVISEHHRTENEVLFPLALETERRVV